MHQTLLKFWFSERPKKFDAISKLCQILVAFSEYLNFTDLMSSDHMLGKA